MHRATAFLLLWLTNALCFEFTHNVVETEMFSIPISPNIFNWTYQEFDQQYRFHAALIGKPELPPWLRYIYSGRHHSGFLFGTPPKGVKSPVVLEVVGLNRRDYESRRLQLSLVVQRREKVARHELQLKIDNLNVEDMLDEHRMTKLKDIFRKKLWTESSVDLYTTFLASAIDMGARLPLQPSEGDGLVIRIGSAVPLSSEVKRLREEVRPLSKLPACPRDYKRTTVERLFRDAGFTLDWCNFELYNTIYKEKSTELIEYLSEISEQRRQNQSKMAAESDVWSSPSKYELPARSYLKELTLAVAVPVLLTLTAVAALTAVLCFHYAGIANKTLKIEQIRYDNNTENRQTLDTDSDIADGNSPNNSLKWQHSPKSKSTTNLAGSYNRPQPPPYLGSASNTLHNRKPCNTDEVHQTGNTRVNHLALEQSLKLLNDAKISPFADKIELNTTIFPNFSDKIETKSILKEPVIDLADGSEDYVPVLTGFGVRGNPDNPVLAGFPIRQDLDDIDIPDLANYGIGSASSVI